jgi:hypothetical protein
MCGYWDTDEFIASIACCGCGRELPTPRKSIDIPGFLDQFDIVSLQSLRKLTVDMNIENNS